VSDNKYFAVYRGRNLGWHATKTFGKVEAAWEYLSTVIIGSGTIYRQNGVDEPVPVFCVPEGGDPYFVGRVPNLEGETPAEPRDWYCAFCGSCQPVPEQADHHGDPIAGDQPVCKYCGEDDPKAFFPWSALGRAGVKP
jgi:hypothetical protein